MRRITTTLFLMLVISVSAQQTLEGYIQTLLQENYGILVQRTNLAIAKNENHAGNAGYLPTIGVDAQQNVTINSARQEFLNGFVNEANNARNQGFDAGVALNWTFFDGFKMFITDKKLDLMEDRARFELLAEIELKVYQASMAYYSLLSLQEQRKLREASIELSVERLKQIQAKKQAGAANRLELLQVQLDVNADSAALLQNLRDIKHLQAELNTMINRPTDAGFETSEALPEWMEEIVWENTLQLAQKQNTAILLAKANTAIIHKEREELKSRYYPQLGLYANYNFGSSRNQVGFLLTNRVYGPGFGVYARWDILDNLSRYKGLKTLQLREDQAEYLAKEQTQFISLELRKAYESYQYALSNYKFERRTQIDAQEVFDISKEAYNLGSMTALELREIQFAVQQAENRLILAKMELISARLGLSLVTGNFGLAVNVY
jgi:outer membrane protein